jgi:flagellar hook-length control protein FliK
MEVDLLTNALVSNVGVASGGAEPIGAKRSPTQQAGSSAGIDQGATITPDNNQIHASKKLTNDKPSKNFAETLEERMQAEASETAETSATAQTPATAETVETAENTENIGTAAMGNQSSPEQSESVPSQVSADLSVELDKITVETANTPQQQAAAEDSQLLPTSAISTSIEPAAGHAEAAAMPAGVQSPEELIKLTAKQAQIESKDAQPPQGNTATTLDVQTAQIAPTDPQKDPYDDSVAQQETAGEEKTGELVNESLEDGGKAEMPLQKAGNAVGQTVANTEPALQDNPDTGKEASSNAQGDSAKTEPNISAGAFTETEGRADAEQQTKTLPQSSENSGKEVFDGEEAGSTKSPVQKLDTAQNLNTAQVESVVSQSNGREAAAPKKTDNSIEFEQTVPSETPQISAPERPLVLQASNSPANTAPGDNASAVSEQIRESITSSTVGPDQQITIRLNPPELGTVVIKFREQDNQITGLLEVSKLQTRAEIQQALPEIMRDLQNFGVQIRRLEVVMTAEPESETLTGQSAMPQDDRWGGQQGPGESEPNASVGGLFAENNAYMDSTANSQSYVTDRSIDMFV